MSFLVLCLGHRLRVQFRKDLGVKCKPLNENNVSMLKCFRQNRKCDLCPIDEFNFKGSTVAWTNQKIGIGKVLLFDFESQQ